jgi:DNA-binding transcriptional regulator YdaS (Cro superfamily)
MSRVILLSMSESEAIAKCLEAKVGVSAIERLTSGGVRLVCMSSDGAQTIRKKLKSRIIEGQVVRERLRPANPLW